MQLFKAFSTLAVLLLGLSCGGGNIPPTRYYAIEIPPAPRAQQTLPHTVAVLPVRADEPYVQDRIVYRPSRAEVGFYEYHRWGADPREALQSALINALRAKGTFETVAPYDGTTRADYLLRSRIERLEEVDYEDGVKVYFAMSAELVDGQTNRVVWTGQTAASRSVTTAEVSAVVEQMNQAAEEGIGALAAQIDGHLR